MHLLPGISLLKLLQTCFSRDLPNLLQMKLLSLALKVTLSFLLNLFDANDFQSNNFEKKKYKIKSFVNEISLPN